VAPIKPSNLIPLPDVNALEESVAAGAEDQIERGIATFEGRGRHVRNHNAAPSPA